MLVSERVYSNPHICGIQLDVSGKEFASGGFDTQPFYNTNISQGNFKEVYHSKGSARFSEESSESVSGTVYAQRVQLRFPSNDAMRSVRLEELRKVKFLSLAFSNGQSVIIGRNDFFQNTRPRVKVSSTEKITEVEFRSTSIFPIGFFENTNVYGFPYELPVSFLEPI